MRLRSILCSLGLLGYLFCVGIVSAQEQVVVNQQYELGGRFELTLTPVALTTFDKYTRHIGSALGIAFFFNDFIGLEAEGGYAYVSGDRKLLDEILTTAADTSIEGISYLPLTDLKHMTGWLAGGLVLNPFYGKLDFSSELALSFHLYLVAGAGVAEYHYSWLNHNLADPQFSGRFGKVDENVGPRVNFYYGGGLRFHMNETWSLKLEMRDVFFYDKYDAQHKPSGVAVVNKTIQDFVHTTFLRLSVCLTF